MHLFKHQTTKCLLAIRAKKNSNIKTEHPDFSSQPKMGGDLELLPGLHMRPVWFAKPGLGITTGILGRKQR